MTLEKKKGGGKEGGSIAFALGRYVTVAVRYSYIGFFVPLILIALLLPRYPFIEKWKLLIIFVVICLLTITATLSLRKTSKAIALRPRLGKFLPLTLLLLGILVHIVVAYYLLTDPSLISWDAGMLYRTALKALHSQSFTPYEVKYYNMYPFNSVPSLLLVGWLRLWSLLGLNSTVVLTSLLNIIFMQSSLVFLYLTVKEMINKKYAILSAILASPLIILSPWTRIFYTDTLGITFPIGIFYLYYKIKKLINKQGYTKRAISLIALLALLIPLGLGMKIYTVVIVGAVIVFDAIPSLYVHKIRKKLTIKEIYAVAVVGAVSISVYMFIISPAFVKTISPSFMLGKSVPVSHYLKMGLEEDCFPSGQLDAPKNCEYGAWNLKDATALEKAANMQQYSSASLKEAKTRLRAYGIMGYLRYSVSKGAWIIGDGTFYAYGEGRDSITPPVRTGNVVYDYLYAQGYRYDVYHLFSQIEWTFILLLILIPTLFWKRIKDKKQALVLMVSLIGVVLMSMLLEGRSRYIYTYMPLFIVVATQGIYCLRHRKGFSDSRN